MPWFRFDPQLELCDQPVQRGISRWKNQEIQIKYNRKEPLQSGCMTYVIRNSLILKINYLVICVILAYKQM